MHVYDRKDSPHPDDDSDEDLPLEELDLWDARNRARQQSGRLYAPSAGVYYEEANGDVQLHNLRTPSHGPGHRRRDANANGGSHIRRIRRQEPDEDLQDPLLGSKQQANDTADDDAPLLPEGDEDVRPDRPARRSRRASAVSRFWNKLQASPQTALDDDHDPSSDRRVDIGRRAKFPPNVVSNAKYTPWSFLPRTLYNEFSFFLNLYFLLVALSQVIPQLRIGYLSTYVAPLAFVLTIAIGKEAIDDITRRRRDAELNTEQYTVLEFGDTSAGKSNAKKTKRGRRRNARSPKLGPRLADLDEEEARIQEDGNEGLSDVREVSKASKDLNVGDVLKLGKDQRIPADAIVLKSTSSENAVHDDQGDGEIFIRTDQLDGETDWKLRIAPLISQRLKLRDFEQLSISAGKPDRKVNDFSGTLSISPKIRYDNTSDSPVKATESLPLNIDNTAWANTILASSATVYAAVVYTGTQTRQALSTSASRTKTGLLEYEINALTKILCALTLLLSVFLVAAYKFESPDGRKWYITVMRYLILFSTIIPISLRVNLDMGKSVYAWFIQRDKDISGTIVRTSTIPEDLGRIEYLLSDKTGTLTQNGK